jgi:MoxR-like ATPase
LNAVLNAGWALEQKPKTDRPKINEDDIRAIQKLTSTVELQTVRPAYIDLIQKLRNAGVQVSDRRAVKLQRLVAASALLCKRENAIQSDFWVLRYIWDTEEQVEVIASIVNSVVEADEEKINQHPRASVNSVPNADEIYNDIMQMTKLWENPETSMADRSVIKDRLRYLNGRCEWIINEEQKLFVQKPIDELWEKIMQVE